MMCDRVIAVEADKDEEYLRAPGIGAVCWERLYVRTLSIAHMESDFGCPPILSHAWPLTKHVK